MSFSADPNLDGYQPYPLVSIYHPLSLSQSASEDLQLGMFGRW